MVQVRFGEDELAAWLSKRAAGSERFVFGIAGAPGSGKSTLARRIATQLDAVLVPMDGFHLPNEVLDRRGLRHVKGSPRTFDAEAFIRAVSDIRRAHIDLALPDFDRLIDEPRPARVLVPTHARIVIVEGNYLLLDSPPWDDLRALFDAVAHLDVDDDVRIGRLIERHARFGRTWAEAAAFAEASDEPNARLAQAVAHRAHVVIAGAL